MVGYYPFNDGTANDMSGIGSNGVIIGSFNTVPDREGNQDAAISLDSLSKILLLGTINNHFDPEDTTSISFWYKGSTANENDYEIILSKGEPPSTSPNHYSLGLYQDNKMAFSQCSQESDNIDTNNWNHIVCIYINGSRTMYINCSLESTSESDFFESNAHVLTLNQSYFGIVDDLLFYNRVLSFEEIKELYHLPCSNTTRNNNVESDFSFNVFPNPSTNFIIVESAITNGSIDIIDSKGQLLNTHLITNNRNQKINIEGLSNSLYFLVLKDISGQFMGTKEIIKM